MVDRSAVTISAVSLGFREAPESDAPLTKGDNIKRALRLLDVAGERGSDVVCLPELFATKGTENQREAEAVPGGDVSRALSAAAKRNKMYVVGCLLEDKGGQVYNTVAVFDRVGGLVGTSNKVHLPPGEVEYTTPGDSFKAFETDFGKVGAVVCYDIHFPESVRSLALGRADVVFWPTMYGAHWEQIAEVLVKARAIENRIFMVSANYAQPTGSHIGFSAVVSPRGEILANTGRVEGVATAVVDLDDKGDGPDIFEKRRPDLYGRIVE